eukprot:CAMPEP_0201487600 /NCGR_PEP_ID=MMETSP0151_2-20130828/13941_1 /ASSEMBLY_ACC=CAM_ASM_000257 /TAXON_ID=200890 /ORGANISM="Paramoeba atlantica, Strain 621/1 / CCAP 1560/9" /LENGTH=179 /DNA_ID=CAMNT_0047872683 /DNA_START=122 /DNA_END=661 /DNA_ORIENTATION=+
MNRRFIQTSSSLHWANKNNEKSVSPNFPPQQQSSPEIQVDQQLSKSQQTSEKDEFEVAVPESTKKKEGKIKIFIKKYGPMGVAIYSTLYLGPFAAWYMAFSTGAVDTQIVFDFLQSYVEDIESYEKGGNLVLAWGLTEVMEPIRLGLTVALTSPILRLYRKRTQKNQEEEKESNAEQKK